MSADMPDAANPAAFDPADYPFRLLLRPEAMRPEASVLVCWQATPWPESTLRDLLAGMAAGGGVYLMARERGELVRQRECLELILSVAAES